MSEYTTPEPAEATYTTDLELARIIKRKLTDAFHTPLPWTARESDDGWYIAGPPETAVVIEGVSKNDALLITDIVNSAARLSSTVEMLHESLYAGDEPDSEGALFSLARKLSIELAQASGNPIRVPEAKTAGDLSSLHVGCQISVEGSGSYHVADVLHSQDNIVTIESIYPESVIVLHKDIEVEVTHWWGRDLPISGDAVVEPPDDEDEDEVPVAE